MLKMLYEILMVPLFWVDQLLLNGLVVLNVQVHEQTLILILVFVVVLLDIGHVIVLNHQVLDLEEEEEEEEEEETVLHDAVADHLLQDVVADLLPQDVVADLLLHDAEHLLQNVVADLLLHDVKDQDLLHLILEMIIKMTLKVSVQDHHHQINHLIRKHEKDLLLVHHHQLKDKMKVQEMKGQKEEMKQLKTIKIEDKCESEKK